MRLYRFLAQKHLMRGLLCAGLAAVLVCCMLLPRPVEAAASLSAGSVSAPSAVLADARTGKILFSKNADQQVYPASTTKIMTALLTMEYMEKEDRSWTQQVTIGNEVNKIASDSTKMYIAPGDVVTMEDLLYGLMVPSGNDAAMALAVAVAGTVEDFVALMNARAAELGMTNTHYVNPHGLHDSQHYTTAADMLKVTLEARKHEIFLKVVASPAYTFAATATYPVRTYNNSNHLLNAARSEYYADCTGIKTGYTTAAQGCLVASAKRGDTELLALIFKDVQAEKFATAAQLFEHGFSNYQTINLVEQLANRPVVVTLPNAAKDDAGGGVLSLQVDPVDTAYFTGTKAEVSQLIANLENVVATYQPALEEYRAPLQQGQVVGQVRYTLDGEELFTANLKASRTVEEYRGLFSPLVDFDQRLRLPLWGLSPVQWYAGLFGVLSLLALIVLSIGIVRNRRLDRRRKNRQRTRMQ